MWWNQIDSTQIKNKWETMQIFRCSYSDCWRSKSWQDVIDLESYWQKGGYSPGSQKHVDWRKSIIQLKRMSAQLKCKCLSWIIHILTNLEGIDFDVISRLIGDRTRRGSFIYHLILLMNDVWTRSGSCIDAFQREMETKRTCGFSVLGNHD
jgi:hypothetical protein